MYPFQNFWITLCSTLKEGPNDLEILLKSRFKAHIVVEDEMWILVSVVLLFDVRFFNVIMSDINGGLQSYQRWIECF
jgi:hypothetical protein